MKRTSSVFKFAVRYCKNNIEEMKADAFAKGLIDNDCHKFYIPRNFANIQHSFCIFRKYTLCLSRDKMAR